MLPLSPSLAGDWLTRLATLSTGDPALAILGAVSFAEAAMRSALGLVGDKSRSFRELARLASRAGGSEALGEVLALVPPFHDIANSVRHDFRPADPEEARAAFYLADALAKELGAGTGGGDAWTAALDGLLAPWKEDLPREEGPAWMEARERLGGLDEGRLEGEIEAWDRLGRKLAGVETALIGAEAEEEIASLRAERKGILEELARLEVAKGCADSLRRILAPMAARRSYPDGPTLPASTFEIESIVCSFLMDTGAESARRPRSPLRGPEPELLLYEGDCGKAARRVAFECGVLGEGRIALIAFDPLAAKRFEAALADYGIEASEGESQLGVFLPSGEPGKSAGKDPWHLADQLAKKILRTRSRLLVAVDREKRGVMGRWWIDALDPEGRKG